jgi:hypothetical protein
MEEQYYHQLSLLSRLCNTAMMMMMMTAMGRRRSERKVRKEKLVLNRGVQCHEMRETGAFKSIMTRLRKKTQARASQDERMNFN